MRTRTFNLLQGTLDLLILQALTTAPQHGYAIARWIEGQTEDALRIEEGSLYPALHRLEERGWVEAEWGASTGNRRIKIYRLTAQGRRQRGLEVTSWLEFVAAVSKILRVAVQPA